MRLFLILFFIFGALTLSAKEGIVVDSQHKLVWQDNIEHSELIWKLTRGYCSQLNLGGFDDWRMPTRKELISLGKNKQLKQKFHYLEDGLYWSKTEEKGNDLSAYTIYSGNGHDSISDKCDKYFAVCVRGTN